MFTIKNLHRGNNKINWTRTIGHSQAFIQSDEVVYMNPVNKKRIINYEEELFVIFYSILNYLNGEYGFHAPINIQYDLITGKQFKQYLHGLGKTRLMQIKYKYFSDKALQLWDLCYAFFENSYRIAINTHAQEYILAKSFNVVFEAMIDELIGTPHNRIPKGLADQDDGKRVDHMYTDLALTSADTQKSREVYYIGDSKYYKSGHPLTSESIYKQYTYARNVIQWNVNLFAVDDSQFDKKEKDARNEDKKHFSDIHLQDNSLTEGYDVIPNFFINAFVNKDHRYNDGGNNIRKHKNKGEHCTKVSYQFPDRLFDRDTLFLSQYDVNFLYILYLYGRNKANEKVQWKQHVRKIFRDEIRAVIEKEFKIYAMRARLGVDGVQYLQQHFYELNGRVFQPYGEERSMFFAYARPAKKMADEHNAKITDESERFDVFFGIEYYFEGDEYLIYGVDEDWLYANPDVMDKTRVELHELVSKAGGIMVQAHPYRERWYIDDIILTPAASDGIEIYNAANKPNMNALGYEYACKLDVPMSAGSDIHFFYDGAKGGMMFDRRLTSIEDYIDAFMNREGTPVILEDGKVQRVLDTKEQTVPLHKQTYPLVIN